MERRQNKALFVLPGGTGIKALPPPHSRQHAFSYIRLWITELITSKGRT